MDQMPFTPRTLVLVVLAAALLGGCASFSADGGFGAIQSATQARIQKDVVWSRDEAARSQTQARIDALLAKPLSADDAVQIALLNNPGLQAAFNTLGIAEADWVAARRLPNPGVSIGRLTQGSEVEWDRTVSLDLMRLLTMPMRADIEQRLFEQTRQGLVLEVLRVAAETRRAWVVAVAAEQSAQYQQQAMEAAEAGRGTGASHGAGGQLEQAEAGARAGVLCRCRVGGGACRTGERTGARAPGSADGVRQCGHNPIARRPARSARGLAAAAGCRAARDGHAPRPAGDRLQTEALAQEPGAHPRAPASSTCWSSASCNNSFERGAAQRGYEIDFELPLFDWGRLARGAGRIALPPGARPRTRNRGQRAFRSARGLSRLPHRLRHRAALPRRDGAAARSASPTKTCCATTAC